MMKRQVLLIAFVGMGCAAVAQSFSGGTGTAADPYLISSKADLEALGTMVDTPGEGDTQQTYGKYFRLTQDITDPVTSLIGMEGFFKGDFDGGGHCITLAIDMPNEDYIGLFGTVKTGSVHDLAVRGSVSGRRYVGGVVANPTNGAQLYNLVNYATISSAFTSIAYVGGVVGGIASLSDGDLPGVTMSRCANYGTIVCDGGAVGGVIGYSGQAVGNTLSDLANYGLIDNAGAQRVGGVVGNPMYYDKIHRVANFGVLSDPNLMGCLGNSNPTDLGELFYDQQYAYTLTPIPAQERNTAEMTGTQLQSALGDGWVYDDNLLPRPAMNGLEDADLAVLYATPVLLADGDWLGHVTQNFQVSLGNTTYGRVTWIAQNGLVAVGADGTVTLRGDGEEVLTASLGGQTRSLHLLIDAANAISAAPTGTSADSSTWYDLAGRVVKHPTHGVYIVNGKKVVR